VAPVRRVDPDFAEEVLADLYRYRRKRRWLAFLLWAPLGWLGAHRFYLDRPGTALLMMFSLGGGTLWWFADGFLIGRMVREQHAEQERRRQLGLPPLELDFMPPLRRDALDRPPDWTDRWRQAGPLRRALRFIGDVMVLLIAGTGLGYVARSAGVWEAILAVLVLVGLTAAGATVGRVAHLPVIRGLVLWSHRLRLFYYYSRPGSPMALLFRPITGALLAPFRRRGRAEVRLYLQLGGVFTLAFLLLDFGAEVLGPMLLERSLPALSVVFTLWVEEATVTFVVIYAFATPIGAVLTLYLLMMKTHTVPRLLSAAVVIAMWLGTRA
jgi:hypothetical protein